ncbi:hypothetical protein, unlikely [Trypanosoma brucei brucei TREU927]|uniref:Uncharacterized protein n=2 Tax=Trypanosoma brucei TaxID=5691 RepID=Q38FG6_TRYB2|nr:hypothetical protein, unlikely [Trypanosoma brucei brucei TREU927]EAN76454.1 hypothetical protein, unlikely [Trypanosoma brucei brucei TREU927]RHW70134.1 hypothetical protein DPX39_090013500 [Trypanosoma brucei equiperdum]
MCERYVALLDSLNFFAWCSVVFFCTSLPASSVSLTEGNKNKHRLRYS